MTDAPKSDRCVPVENTTSTGKTLSLRCVVLTLQRAASKADALLPLALFPPPNSLTFGPPSISSARKVGQLWREGQRCTQGGRHGGHRRGPLQGHSGAIPPRGDQAAVDHHPGPGALVHFRRTRGCHVRGRCGQLMNDGLPHVHGASRNHWWCRVVIICK